MNNTKQTGFTIIEVTIAIFVLLLLGFVGYRVYSAQKGSDSEISKSSSIQEEPAISDKNDLSESVDKLNDVNTDTRKDEAELKKVVE